MTVYFVSFVVLSALLLLYFRIAEHFKIIDKPNERSSHSHATIRGGGIIFLLAALIWFFFYGSGQAWMIAGLTLVALVSFLDDLFNLSGWIRLLAQVLALSLFFFQPGFPVLPLYILIPAYIVALGWINGFNFMDGINGITPFYSLIAIATFLFLNTAIEFMPVELAVLLIIALVIFSFFNARVHARVFAGDVGSVSMAYLLSVMMIHLIIKTGRFEYVLFFSVYAVDIAFTIFFRLLRRENIFRAHRSHLYQLLSNELGFPHVLVSAIYAMVQGIINVVVILMIQREMMGLKAFLVIAVSICLGYLVIRYSVKKKIDNHPLNRP
jgi:UDP-N-acetylmuramyl pentapeptide phosphotransferase/UDP-N-acetylglucosamine-1-phosphate transferase